MVVSSLFKNKKFYETSGLTLVFLVFLFFSFLFFRGGINHGQAALADNVRGWAWGASSTGWISFNCVNDNSCGASNYGVRIDPVTKNFSGYAWSSNVGWISFQDTSAEPGFYNFNSHCSAVCNAGNNCSACFDPDTGYVWGWAKILAMGDNGWIRLRDDVGTYKHGVYVDQLSASSSWRGWAWNGGTYASTSVGWINFNCEETGTCGLVDYKVWVKDMTFPTVDNLSAPNWNYEAACFATKGFTLRWRFEDKDPGAFESAYRVIVSTSSSPATPFIDTGKRSYASVLQFSTTTSAIKYTTPYYWWVMVWDNFGLASPWMQFYTGTPSSTLTDNIARNNAVSPSPLYTFTTYDNEFPDVDFSWAPEDPLVNEIATTTDNSRVYFPASPSVPVNCTESICSWLWSGTGVKTNSTPTASSTAMTFNYGNFFIRERVTGPGGYTCTSSRSIFIDLLPKWREVKPAN